MDIRPLPLAVSLLITAALAGCSEPANLSSDPTPDPQAQFMAILASHCGKAFEGRLVSEDEVDADFVMADMVMHVRECSDERITVPFHVKTGDEWDRSRTWVFTRTDDGLRLKHDHRHKDGSSYALTMYGGDTAEDGTPTAQSFPVDEESIALFKREAIPDSITNVWTVEVDPADAPEPTFAYQLKRTVEGGAPEPRLFRVEFDLSQEVEAPPPAWGWE